VTPLSTKHLGKQTVVFSTYPTLLGWGNAVGRKEGEGPLASAFDTVDPTDRFGEKSWEKAESAAQKAALDKALSRAGRSTGDLEMLLAGDLLNQCAASSFAHRSRPVPFLGLYGACSTMAEGLALGGVLLEGDFAQCCAVSVSSHFCTAERQYRMPLEYGGQRTPTAQWTVTGAGAVVLDKKGHGPYLTHATFGKIVDMGVTDANNMGAAMAPAAYDTIKTHLEDTGRSPDDYDLIVTGDLGQLGASIVADFFERDGHRLKEYTDCGLLIYDRDRQDVHCGGSGCGCSAAVLTAHLLPGLRAGRWKKLLFCGTGALLSPTTSMQGESVPGICHAVAISADKED